MDTSQVRPVLRKPAKPSTDRRRTFHDQLVLPLCLLGVPRLLLLARIGTDTLLLIAPIAAITHPCRTVNLRRVSMIVCFV